MTSCRLCHPATPCTGNSRRAPEPRRRNRQRVRQDPTMRRWSVFLWPVALAAMSESTPSAGAAEHAFSICGAPAARKSSTAKSTPGIGSMSQKIDAEDLARRPRSRQPFSRRPATSRRARRRDRRCSGRGLQDMIALVDLDQLKGGARALALALGAGDIGIVELALEPERRRQACACARFSPAS